MRDFGSSLPRNFSRALPTESFSVMIQASPFVDRCRTSNGAGCAEQYATIRPHAKMRTAQRGDDLSFSSLADLRFQGGDNGDAADFSVLLLFP